MSLEEMGAELVATAARLGRYSAMVAKLSRQQRGREAAVKRKQSLEEMTRVGQNLCPGCFRPVLAGGHGRVCRYEAARRKHVRELSA